ncbi:MutT/NUDIX hydrolase [Pseudomonas phage vB_PpuM-Voja-6]
MEKRGVYAIIRNTATGDVLLARRSAKVNNAGTWNLPGGRLDAGEKAAVALRRELAEELGWHTIKSEPWKRIKADKLDADRVYVLINLTHVPPITLNDEHDRFLWIQPQMLRLFQTNPPTKHFLSTVNVLEVLNHG